MSTNTTSTPQAWLTQNAFARLQHELATLLRHREEAGDHDPDRLVENVHRQARIRQIEDLLRHAVVGENPPDDGIAEPGMVLTVRYDDEDQTETFLLGSRDVAQQGDVEVYSPDSPLGKALTGAKLGECRVYAVPNGDTVRVTLVKAAPYGYRQT